MWTPVLLFNLINHKLQTCYFLQTNIFLPHIRLILCYSKPVRLTTSPLSWGKVSWLCCVQVPRQLSNSIFLAPLTPSEAPSSPTGSITLVSQLRETCCCTTSYLPLGVSQQHTHRLHQAFFWRRCRGNKNSFEDLHTPPLTSLPGK